MVKKAYIGASYSSLEMCQDLTTELEGRGIEITRKWWETYVKGQDQELDSLSDEYWYAHPRVQEIRTEDFAAIEKADIVIIIANYPEPLTGALVELGYALALDKKVIIVGVIKKSAMFSSCIIVSSPYELFELLEYSECEFCGNDSVGFFSTNNYCHKVYYCNEHREDAKEADMYFEP